MCRIVGLFYCFFGNSVWYNKMVSRKKIFPLFYCSKLLIYTFCEVLFVLSSLNSHVLTFVSATRALPLAFPGPLPFPEGIDNYYLLFLLLILAILFFTIYFPICKNIHITSCCCRVAHKTFITRGGKIRVAVLISKKLFQHM